jgi:hypothetical protein
MPPGDKPYRCTIYSIEIGPGPGGMPAETLKKIKDAWYGELNFEAGAFISGMQEHVEVNARIRLTQDRRISNHNIVTLADGHQYRVVRAYHGVDKKGQKVSDLSLQRLVQEYDIG